VAIAPHCLILLWALGSIGGFGFLSCSARHRPANDNDNDNDTGGGDAGRAGRRLKVKPVGHA